MRILLQNSHHQTGRPNGWSGAPGEADWVLSLNRIIQAELEARGHRVVRVDGDLMDHPQYKQDYDAFVTAHYEADVHGGLGGAFWGRAANSATAAEDDRLGNIFWRHFRNIERAPRDAFNWSNPNVTDYYGFRLTTANTPGILVEHGVGWGADKAWLREKIHENAMAWVHALEEFTGESGDMDEATVKRIFNSMFEEKGVTSTDEAIKAVLAQQAHHRHKVAGGPTEPDFKVMGTSQSSIAQMTSKLRGTNPNAPTGIEGLYWQHATAAGIRPEIAFAQALKETDYFRFTGTARLEWNNPAGLGVTGAAGAGNQFPSWDVGVRAHIGHLLWYFGTHMPEFCAMDQRHFGDHKNLANDIRLLNGRWAVPGTGYGETIESGARTMVEGGLTTSEPI